jgi:hypothetical protein
MEYLKDNQPFKEIMYFQDNQLLTAEQLNGVLRYLNSQNRFTRARLDGAGIVSGLFPDMLLLPSLQFSGKVKITPGTAITGDGDLIQLTKEALFEWAIPFENGKDKTTTYGPLQEILDQPGAIMMELLPAQITGAVPLTDVYNSLPADKKVVFIIYVHQYEELRDICDPDDCDCKGSAEISRYRVIMVTREHYEAAMKTYFERYQRFRRLNPVLVKRPLLDNTTVTYGGFVDQIKKVVEENTPHITEAIEDIDELVRTVYEEAFGKRGRNDGTSFFNLYTMLGSTGSSFKSTVGANMGKAGKYPPQYLYSFLCDVADACNEIYDCLREEFTDFMENPPVFPKHVMIGTAHSPIGSDNVLIGGARVYDAFCRSFFTKHESMVFTDKSLYRLLGFYMRLAMIVRNCDIEQAATAISIGKPVRVSPSLMPSPKLAHKAVPIYYMGSVAEAWRIDPVPAYLGRFPMGFWGHDRPGVSPLKNDLEHYNFYRIEGHIGRTYEEAYKAINELRNDYDLPFDILGLQLETNVKTIIPTKDIKLGNLDILHDFNKLQANDFLRKMEGFNDVLTEKVPVAVTQIKAKGINDDFVQQHKPVDAIADEINEAKTQLSANITNLKTLINTTKASAIRTEELSLVHDTILDKAKTLSTNSRLLLRNDIVTPLQNFTYFFNPAQFQWLNGYANVYEEATKDMYVFSNFMKVNPGMTHGGGVSKGGTFILLYAMEGNVRRVVGDYYVPYYVEMQPAKIDTSKLNQDIRVKVPDFAIKPDVIRVAPAISPDIFNIKNILEKNELTPTSNIKTQINSVAQTEFTKFKTQVLDTYNNNFNNVFNSFAAIKPTLGGVKTGISPELSGLGALGEKQSLDIKADIMPVAEMLNKELQLLDPAINQALVSKLADITKVTAIARADDATLSRMTVIDKADTVSALTQTLDTIKAENPTLHTTLMTKINLMTRFNK